MITLYDDEKLAILFSIIPEIEVRYILPNMNETQKEIIEKLPFENKKDLEVILIDKTLPKEYEFTIQKRYCWDGATIPRIFWRLIGAKTDPKFLIPSLIHDVLCENHKYVDNDRYFSTITFERLLYVSEVPDFSRWLIKHSVDNYQKLFWSNK